MPPLTSDESAKLQSDMCQIVDKTIPPLTAAEANQIKGSTCWAVEDVEAKSPKGSNTSLPIVPMQWPSASVYSRSGEQQDACQFKFTVSPDEVPRPGRLFASPAGPAGAENFFYKWSQEPFAQFPDNALPGSDAHFSVGQAGYGQRIEVGETWYVAFKMEGGNTGGKFVGDLQVNAA